jgi:hypothetical protein
METCRIPDTAEDDGTTVIFAQLSSCPHGVTQTLTLDRNPGFEVVVIRP